MTQPLFVFKNTVPLEEGRELFLRKKFGWSSKIYRTAITHATREKPLRLSLASWHSFDNIETMLRSLEM